MILIARKGDIQGGMPLNCAECSEYDGHKCCIEGSDCDTYLHTPEWCPIVAEVPEGDLGCDDKIQWARVTNGDIIKAMFPDVESRVDEKAGVIFVKWVNGMKQCFKASWWDSPYMKTK